MTDLAVPESVGADLAAVAAATRRFLATAARLTDAEIAAPSLLPGWTRGHVLAHVARNADSLVNLLHWAETGIETPQYPDPSSRDADIAAGAGRPAAEQHADNVAAADRWQRRADALPPEAWHAVVRNRQGREVGAAAIGWMRWQEVEIHHVDLDAGYSPADWPAEFVARLLPEAVASLGLRDGDHLSFGVDAEDTGFGATVGAGTPSNTVRGSATAILAWLLGRSAGTDLSGELPELPPFR